MLGYPQRLGQVQGDASALSDARFAEELRTSTELCARSIKPLEGSRPWFAADAGPMQIQWWEGAVPSCAGTVRERTAAGTEREESGLGAKFSRKNGSRKWKG